MRFLFAPSACAALLAVSANTLDAQSWSSSPEILPARQGMAATTVDHLALFAGGDDSTQRNVEVNIYDMFPLGGTPGPALRRNTAPAPDCGEILSGRHPLWLIHCHPVWIDHMANGLCIHLRHAPGRQMPRLSV